jgi:hypothetical protein
MVIIITLDFCFVRCTTKSHDRSPLSTFFFLLFLKHFSLCYAERYSHSLTGRRKKNRTRDTDNSNNKRKESKSPKSRAGSSSLTVQIATITPRFIVFSFFFNSHFLTTSKMNSFFLLFYFFGSRRRERERGKRKTRFYDDSVGELTKITVEPVSFCLFCFFVFFFVKIGLTMSIVWYFNYFCGRTTTARGMSEGTCLCRRRGASILWKWKHALLHQACESFIAFPFALRRLFPPLSCYLSRPGKLFGWDSQMLHAWIGKETVVFLGCRRRSSLKISN